MSPLTEALDAISSRLGDDPMTDLCWGYKRLAAGRTPSTTPPIHSLSSPAHPLKGGSLSHNPLFDLRDTTNFLWKLVSYVPMP